MNLLNIDLLNIKRTTAKITMIAVSMLALSANANAHQSPKLIAADSSALTEVCMAVARDKKLRLINALRHNRLTLKQAHKSIRCNDMTLTEFGEKYHAAKTLAYLQRNAKKPALYTAL